MSGLMRFQQGRETFGVPETECAPVWIQQRVHAWNGFSTLLRLRKWHLHEAEGWTEGKGGYGRLLGLVDMHKDVCAQLRLTICDPVDCSPSVPSAWNFPGKNTGVDCRSILQVVA